MTPYGFGFTAPGLSNPQMGQAMARMGAQMPSMPAFPMYQGPSSNMGMPQIPAGAGMPPQQPQGVGGGINPQQISQIATALRGAAAPQGTPSQFPNSIYDQGSPLQPGMSQQQIGQALNAPGYSSPSLLSWVGNLFRNSPSGASGY